MNQKSFFNGVCNGRKDIIQDLIDLIKSEKIDYCVIGGLAVNAYVEPVVSLDLDIVVMVDGIDRLIQSAKKQFKIEEFPHSVHLKSDESDIRIQIQTDTRYQEFISRATIKNVLGYQMKVASVEDILAGKAWAFMDKERRGSKRQKDLADIMRIIESFPELKLKLPKTVMKAIDGKT